MTDPQKLLADFAAAIAPRRVVVEHESCPAPHKGRKLANGKCAVYVFSLCERYGSGSQAGAHRVLKVGKAGPNSNARFQSQHYNANSAPSTLSGSVLRTQVLWPYLGIESLNNGDVRRWVEESTDRDNFYLVSDDEETLGLLETFLKGRLGPVFEG